MMASAKLSIKTKIKHSEAMSMRLGVLRRERKFSQFELGRRSRVHPATISRIESGRYLPYPGEAKRLARALGVPVKELFEVAGAPKQAK